MRIEKRWCYCCSWRLVAPATRRVTRLARLAGSCPGASAKRGSSADQGTTFINFTAVTASELSKSQIAIAMPLMKAGLSQCWRASVSFRKLQTRCSSSASPSVARLLATPSDGAERQVYGFIRSIRKQKTRAFASIGDGSSLEPLQAMLSPEQAQRYAFVLIFRL